MLLNRNLWKKQVALFLGAQTISLLGSSIVQYAIIWYITLETSSGIMMTISTLCGFLPQVLISTFAGVWVDRYNRKILIMLSDSLIAFSTLILALLFISGYKEIWMLFIVLAIRSAGTGVQMPAVNALIPQITPKKMLMRVNGIFSSINSLMMFLSPAISGIILSMTTIEATFFIDVVTAIIGVGVMSFLTVRTSFRSKGLESLTQLEQLKEGFIYLKNHQLVRFILIFEMVILVIVSPSVFLTPLMVSRTFGPEFWRLTLNEMCFGGGSVLGGIIIAYWGGYENRLKTAFLASFAYGILSIAMGLAPFFSVYLIFNVIIGIFAPIYTSPINVLLQENVEKKMHGRVFSFMQIAGSCALPAGMAIFGPLADIVSVESLLVGCGTLMIVCTYWFSRHRPQI